MHRVLDIEQNSVPGAGASGQTDGGVDGDVMALVGVRELHLSFFAVSAAVIRAVHRAGARIDENPRAGNDLGFLWSSERNFDHIDTKERGIGILVRLFSGASRQFFWLTDERCAGYVDVN